MKEPLFMEKILEGTGLATILNPEQKTKFELTIGTGATLPGHVEWLKSKLPEWEKLLNNHSGTQVIVTRVKSKGGKYLETSLNVELVINGRIAWENIKDPDTQTMLRGQIKKLLAEKIQRDFPPPFNLVEPVFSKDTPDHYTFYPALSDGYWIDQDRELIQNGLKDDIENLCTSHNARFSGITLTKDPARPAAAWVLAILWNIDTHDANRLYFAEGLKSLLEQKLSPKMIEITYYSSKFGLATL